MQWREDEIYSIVCHATQVVWGDLSEADQKTQNLLFQNKKRLALVSKPRNSSLFVYILIWSIVRAFEKQILSKQFVNATKHAIPSDWLSSESVLK